MPWKTNERRGSLGKYPCMILGTGLTLLNSYGGKIAFREGIVGSTRWIYLERERYLKGVPIESALSGSRFSYLRQSRRYMMCARLWLPCGTDHYPFPAGAHWPSLHKLHYICSFAGDGGQAQRNGQNSIVYGALRT